METMCIEIKPYKCVYCGSDNLAFIDGNSQSINYKSLYDRSSTSIDLKSHLYEQDIRYIKCLSCNKLTHINLCHGYPTQTDETKLREQFKPHRG